MTNLKLNDDSWLTPHYLNDYWITQILYIGIEKITTFIYSWPDKDLLKFSDIGCLFFIILYSAIFLFLRVSPFDSLDWGLTFLLSAFLRNCFLCWDCWNGDVMPTLDVALLYSSRAGSDLGCVSGFYLTICTTNPHQTLL